MNLFSLRRIDPLPAALAFAALLLSLLRIDKSGYLNAYYTAAAVSMSQSFHNFLYNAFDPGGFISIDKPPVAFWLQAISVKLLGLHAWSLALPSALAFAGSVALLYVLVRPSFGLAAARLSALILTLTPIAAAVSRTNNADSVLLFCLLLATLALQRAVRTESTLRLCAAAALVGVGFNVKMMQAYLVLPAFALFVLTARTLPWRRLLKQSAAALAVLVAVSLSWATFVDATPADQRPYVGSSMHNSVLELALGYNGIGRLTGQMGGSASAAVLSSSSEDGPPGPLRLLDVKLAGQISWLLPFALFGAVLLGVRRPKLRADVLLWAGWLLPMIVVFSAAGFFHRYYLVMLAPGIAALAGAAIAELCRNRQPAWLLAGGAVAFGTAAYIAGTDGLPRLGLAAAALGASGLLLALALPQARAASKAALALCLAGVLAAPGFWSLTPALYGGSARQPYASPYLADGDSWSRDGEPLDAALVHYLLRHRGDAKYVAAIPSSNSGADSLIIQTREPVLAWGGFKGADPALGVDGIRRMAATGQVRYVLLGGSHDSADAVASWVRQHAAVVPRSRWDVMSRGEASGFSAAAGAEAEQAGTVAGMLGRAVDLLGLHRSYTLYDLDKGDSSVENS
ncbi:glycosyltransferase family 39 protein [Saccharibacillus brassicae]|uniref:Phospholipid carrier-dependent glycosyltransferase n=1 Tax=Saccharibacillus brassicae TaxID=2583377 RepID=A0A4Y6USJ2_SACBS|nr:glycosyltransferase family 39 protein [Saccharibacillus brassicae]QDH20653.1 phospholipid carrier-dependent glycosyltransferase [Saccharibacillus brassicae]